MPEVIMPPIIGAAMRFITSAPGCTSFNARSQQRDGTKEHHAISKHNDNDTT
jgi:hypothetical protein